MSKRNLPEDAPTMEIKLNSLCITKGCEGRRLLKKDFGDGKHCGRCLKKIKEDKGH